MPAPTSPILVLHDDAMMEHDPGPGHPDSRLRLRAILDELDRVEVPLHWAHPAPATRSQVLAVHTERHLRLIESLRGRAATIDLDTRLSPGSVDAAYLAAGAAIDAVSMTGEPRMHVSRSVALVRPPGHHAERDRAMGFCLFNNVAIAAEHAMQALERRRVLIVDWDVHHGNGTQHAFEHRDDVLYFSTHRGGFYPGTGGIDEIGVGPGTGYTVNVPLPPGCGDEVHVALYRRLLLPIARAFAPDVVLVSAGFDSHTRDPLGGMHVTNDGFAALCAIVCEAAERSAAGRVALVLEGGYDLSALAQSVHRCIQILAGAAPPRIAEPTGDEAALVDRAVAYHGQRWAGVE